LDFFPLAVRFGAGIVSLQVEVDSGWQSSILSR
jgi:hypothetical protein